MKIDSVKPHNTNSSSHGLAHHVYSRLSISFLGGGPCPAWDIRVYLFIYLSTNYPDPPRSLHKKTEMIFVIFYEQVKDTVQFIKRLVLCQQYERHSVRLLK